MRALRCGLFCCARVTTHCNPGVVSIPMHFSEAAANLLTIDTLDATAKIPEYKACAASLTLAKERNWQTPEQEHNEEDGDTTLPAETRPHPLAFRFL